MPSVWKVSRELAAEASQAVLFAGQPKSVLILREARALQAGGAPNRAEPVAEAHSGIRNHHEDRIQPRQLLLKRAHLLLDLRAHPLNSFVQIVYVAQLLGYQEAMG